MENCGNCRFADAEATSGTEAIQCHRYAPRPKMYESLHPDSMEVDQSVVWPVLETEDWCGEWQPAK